MPRLAELAMLYRSDLEEFLPDKAEEFLKNRKKMSELALHIKLDIVIAKIF